jgi:lipopolysaccharide transport system permease protein
MLMESVVEEMQRRDATAQATPTFVLEPSRAWFSLKLKELWAYRELLYFLVWRDVKVRYKQTALGVLWVVLQPLLMTVLFSVVFGGFAGLPSEGVPYPIFAFVALLPWQLFAYALSTSSTSLILNQQLITKVFFPRLIVPLAAVLVGVIDFAIGLLVLLGMMVYYQIALTAAILTLPLLVLLALAAATAVGLWLSALNVQYRDVQYTVPFLTQFWLFATPIAYPASLIPEQWQWLYGLNPMVGVVEGFRWALLGQTQPLGSSFVMSVVVTMLLLLGGLLYFGRVEKHFADII